MSTFCKVFLCVLSINSLTSSYCWIYSNTYNTQGGKDWAPQTVHDPVHRTATYERGRALTNNTMITLSAPQRQSLVTNQLQIQFLGYSVKLIILQTVALKKTPEQMCSSTAAATRWFKFNMCISDAPIQTDCVLPV